MAYALKGLANLLAIVDFVVTELLNRLALNSVMTGIKIIPTRVQTHARLHFVVTVFYTLDLSNVMTGIKFKRITAQINALLLGVVI